MVELPPPLLLLLAAAALLGHACTCAQPMSTAAGGGSAVVSNDDVSGVTVVSGMDGSSSSFHPTIPQAQRHVRMLRAAGATGEIVLEIEGTHPPFSVGQRDSGLHPNARTVYRGKGAKTRISGGTEIPPALFKPSAANPALLTADISSLNLDLASFGEIAAAECVHTCATTRAVLSFGDEEMTLARWPNIDRAKGRNVYTHVKSPGESGGFVYAPDNATVRARVLNWAKEGGGWLHGYWQFDWADCYRKIVQAELMPAVWEVQIAGQFHPTVAVNGSAGATFRVGTVASGGPDDPRDGACMKYWNVTTTNVLERHYGDSKPWVVVAPLACGNTHQWVASANFTPAGMNVQVDISPADVTPGSNARFYATNLLSELDQRGEYFFELSNTSMKVHMMPPPGYPIDPAQWHSGPVVGLKDPVVNMSGSKHTSLLSMQVLHGRGVGVLATDVVDVQIHDINSSLHTRQGMWLYGVDSSITNCSVSAVGCAGIRAHGGNAATLAKGNLSVLGNRVHSFARWKRTYQAGIHWSGVSNSYSHNTVSDSPHNCFLGGGNEADADNTLAGVDCMFEGNALSRCAYEAADAGAFYTCGQRGAAFVNRGNVVKDSTFIDIRNTAGKGTQTAGVNAIYLDDDMSGWSIINNRFVNCEQGVVIGGGRRNTVSGNYYERCDLALHMDNRGMGGQPPSQVPNCTSVCKPLSSGCTCNTGAAKWMVTEAPAAQIWGQRFPYLKNLSVDRLGQPAYNTIESNTYCKCGKFIDASQTNVEAWGSTATNNTEAKAC